MDTIVWQERLSPACAGYNLMNIAAVLLQFVGMFSFCQLYASLYLCFRLQK